MASPVNTKNMKVIQNRKPSKNNLNDQNFVDSLYQLEWTDKRDINSKTYLSSSNITIYSEYNEKQVSRKEN